MVVAAQAFRPRPDEASFAGLVRQHQAWVWRYLRCLGCDPGLADDLTQDTFVAFYRRRGVPVGPAATRTYLRKVARSQLAKARRRWAHRIEEVDAVLAERAFEAFTRGGDGSEFVDALRHCLARLDARSQQALALRYGDRLSRREVGDRLGVSDEGAKSLLARGIARLRGCVERRLA
ncbi:MAG: sigma-70 family RNA polymerase sigma factor [Planctomycetota bacterium]